MLDESKHSRRCVVDSKKHSHTNTKEFDGRRMF